jgi:dihydrofolate reductase
MDGYIARPDGDISWLSTVESKGEDYGYSKFIETIDTVIMGRKTYHKVLTFAGEFPHKGRKCYIITRSKRSPMDNMEFYNGDIAALVKKIRSKEGKHIFLDGGAQLVNSYMKLDMIDEYIISIVPRFLGAGISLFPTGRPEVPLKLESAKSYPSGLVQLHYIRNRN